MTYPTISAKKASIFRDELMSLPESERIDAKIDLTEFVEYRSGDFDESLLLIDADAVRLLWDTEVKRRGKISKDDLVELEVQFAEKVFKSLEKTNLDCLEDEDFWRYLALIPYRWYLLVREPELKPQDYGGLSTEPVLDRSGKPELDENQVPKTRLVKSNMINQLLYRTYLIGKAIEDKSSSTPFERAGAIAKKGPITDVWQSHTIRVEIGRIGVLRHAFVDRVRTEKKKQKEFARELAKLLTRLTNNILLDHQTKPESDLIVGEKATDAILIVSRKAKTKL